MHASHAGGTIRIVSATVVAVMVCACGSSPDAPSSDTGPMPKPGIQTLEITGFPPNVSLQNVFCPTDGGSTGPQDVMTDVRLTRQGDQWTAIPTDGRGTVTMTFTLTESTRVSWLSSGSGTIAGVAFDDGLPGQAYPSPIVPSPPTRLSMSATADGGSATFSALTVTTDSLVPGGVILSGEASGVFDFTNGTSTAHCSTALITMRAVQ